MDNQVTEESGCRVEAGPAHLLTILLGTFAFILPGLMFAAVESLGLPQHTVTNVSVFASLTPSDYLEGCNFRLSGLVTLVDAERDLIVLQDATGAIAINFPVSGTTLRIGQWVTLSGTNCVPYVQRFPKYPHRASWREVLPDFEVPRSDGEYYLSRVRAYLKAPCSGEYTFWIASDNSSELWLSADETPARAQKIASISRFEWVAPREWSKYPSQRSVPVSLQAGRTYYIEALHEQTTMDGHLAVAWRGPGLELSVIEGKHLTQFSGVAEGSSNEGVTREVWTHFMAGTLSGVSGAHPFRSILSVESLAVCELTEPTFENPPVTVLDDMNWDESQNFRWVTHEGIVAFVGADERAVWLKLRGSSGLVQVCLPRLNPQVWQRLPDSRIRVEGVCEGVFDINDEWKPGIIWVPDATEISVIGKGGLEPGQSEQVSAPAGVPTGDDFSKQGFYTMRGVVTFNDQVGGVDYLVVQEGESAKRILGGEAAFFGSELRVGDWISLGGALRGGNEIPVLAPLTISQLGRHAMPKPFAGPLTVPTALNHAGRWCEFVGVPHSIDSNTTLSIVGTDGSARVWVGKTTSNELSGWIDATVRVQGILLPGSAGPPRILVPSKTYVDVQERPPPNPFDKALDSIAEITCDQTQSAQLHRVRIRGEVTYENSRLLVVQDHSGAIRIQRPRASAAKIGEFVEVIGFPSTHSGRRILTHALLRPAQPLPRVVASTVNLREEASTGLDATLIKATGTVLARKTVAACEVLELLGQQQVFIATLDDGEGTFPEIAIGSRVSVEGICDGDLTVAHESRGGSSQRAGGGALNLLLRSPADLTVLAGPPWWTRTRVIVLTSALALVIAGTMLRIQLLQRKLKREQASQLAFSQHVLGKLEEERSRIAANLHDSLGQALLIIRNRALMAIQAAPDEQQFKDHANQISEATCQAIEEVRQIAQGLHPSLLDRLGLTEAIRACINLASENSSILFASRVDGIDGLFPKDAEIHLFRIVQEAVTNVVKHSEATEAAVVIKRNDSSLAVCVRDNGSGFDPAECAESSNDIGYGLVGIRNRTAILGATLSIDSRPGEGTRLTVEAPLNESTFSA